MPILHASFAVPLRTFQLEIDLEVEGTVALVGPSGAGKTSVLRGVTGLVKPSAGRIALDGEVWFDSARRGFLRRDGRRVAPREMVARPADGFVASFTGANLLHGTARPHGGMTAITLDSGKVIFSTDSAEGPVHIVVYPWEVLVGHAHQQDSALNVIEG